MQDASVHFRLLATIFAWRPDILSVSSLSAAEIDHEVDSGFAEATTFFGLNAFFEIRLRLRSVAAHNCRPRRQNPVKNHTT